MIVYSLRSLRRQSEKLELDLSELQEKPIDQQVSVLKDQLNKLHKKIDDLQQHVSETGDSQLSSARTPLPSWRRKSQPIDTDIQCSDFSSKYMSPIESARTLAQLQQRESIDLMTQEIQELDRLSQNALIQQDLQKKVINRNNQKLECIEAQLQKLQIEVEQQERENHKNSTQAQKLKKQLEQQKGSQRKASIGGASKIERHLKLQITRNKITIEELQNDVENMNQEIDKLDKDHLDSIQELNEQISQMLKNQETKSSSAPDDEEDINNINELYMAFPSNRERTISYQCSESQRQSPHASRRQSSRSQFYKVQLKTSNVIEIQRIRYEEFLQNRFAPQETDIFLTTHEKPPSEIPEDQTKVERTDCKCQIF